MPTLTKKAPKNKFVEAAIESQNSTLTENGAETFKSTTSKVLDFFASGAALRTRNPIEIENIFAKALAENPTLALKTLFYIGDIREGQGERRTFNICLKFLANNRYTYPIDKIIDLIPEYSRWDYLYTFVDSPYEDQVWTLIENQIAKDIISKTPSLLAKWLKSCNTSSKESCRLGRLTAKALGQSHKQYRKTLTNLRTKINLVETKMSQNQWKEIDYSAVPSRAHMNYRKAFGRHDEEGYKSYLGRVKEGKETINSGVLYPYDIIRAVMGGGVGLSNETLELQWAALPNYFEDHQENALVIADVSGSMSGTPITVSLSLAMYIAERNKGAFHNLFMTFSTNPQFQTIEGKTLSERIQSLNSSQWEMSTNLQAAFVKVLETGIKNKVPQKDMPRALYVVSDMEFDQCIECGTNFEGIKNKYKTAGYELPKIFFWNVNSRNDQQPIKANQNGVYLVSGCSPSIFKAIFSSTAKTAYDLMLDTLNVPRYKKIKI